MQKKTEENWKKKGKVEKKNEKIQKKKCTVDYCCNSSDFGVGEQWFPHTI
jgi:hypothetical protein